MKAGYSMDHYLDQVEVEGRRWRRRAKGKHGRRLTARERRAQERRQRADFRRRWEFYTDARGVGRVRLRQPRLDVDAELRGPRDGHAE